MKSKNDYYIGLDIGTNSNGWAVTDENYNIIKRNGKALWGTRLFNEAKTSKERRALRASRRRLERRSWRIELLQELFSQEICKKDPGFYVRMKESGLYKEDKTVHQPNSLFNDVNFNDRAYHNAYPTIYHLRHALMTEDKAFDVRLVYLAIHHIIKHRGHFLFANLKTDEKGIALFEESFNAYCSAVERIIGDYVTTDKVDEIKAIFIDKGIVKKDKEKMLLERLNKNDDKKYKAMMTLAVGGKAKLSDVFGDEDLKDNEEKEESISFADANYESNEPAIIEKLGDRFDVIAALHDLYDWSQLAQIMKGHRFISEAKIEDYDNHKNDLAVLKRVFKQDPEAYNHMFKEPGGKVKDPNYANYSAYVGLCKVKQQKTAIVKCSYEDFIDELKKRLKKLPENKDRKYIEQKIAEGEFLRKAVNKENSIIPYQLHLQELKRILAKAETYLPFLKKKDKYGTVSDKIINLFTYHIPYYVGPMNEHANHCWIVKKDKNGRILPWNFDDKVDVENTAERFIRSMTNKCTYLIGEDVLPKNSLLYTKFVVLNELNNITIGKNLQKLDESMKEKVLKNLFMVYKHVTKREFIDYLLTEGYSRDEIIPVNGLENKFNSSMGPWVDLRRILDTDFNYQDGEQIIKDITIFGNDKKMLKNRLSRLFPSLNKRQIENLSKLSYQGWGKLSEELLLNLIPEPAKNQEMLVDKATGEALNIISAMEKYPLNFMELLSDRYGYTKAIEERNKGKWGDGEVTYEDIENLHISPSVRRPLWQALKIVREIVKIMGKEPSKIFIEMTRNNGVKGKTPVSRKNRLLELYKKCKDDTRDWAKELKAHDEEDFRNDKLYLYYTQMGRSMYTGKPIDINELFNKNLYDIDHIYPQSFTGDDSLDNRVLVEKTVNGKKEDVYPLGEALNGCHISGQNIHIEDVQKEMGTFWQMLSNKGLISKEKYKRLIRTTPLTNAEKAAFIGRQLVETSQSTKACAEILSRSYPNTTIVYSKASNVSRFRKYGGFIKVRNMNDFHHAKDAYLNIVVGNVFYTKFTANPLNFLKGDHPVYTLNTKSLYSHKISRNGVDAWIPAEKDKEGNIVPGHEGTMGTVRKWMRKNNILLTRMTYEGKGGLFNQTIMKKGEGKMPLKGKLPLSDITKYGGYTGVTLAHISLVRVKKGKKEVYILESVPAYCAKSLKTKEDYVNYFEEEWKANGKKYKTPEICIPVIPLQSLIEVNGFKMHISGKNGKGYGVKNAQELCLDNSSAVVLKKVLKHNLQNYGRISDEEVMNLYDLFIKKLGNTIYSKEYGDIAKMLSNKRSKFSSLVLRDKCKLLEEILHLFQCNSSASNLTALGGAKQAGLLKIGKTIGKKDRVYLIEQSITGFYEKRILLNPYDGK